MSNIKQFLLKKFPPSKYMDCPISKEYWKLFDQYAKQEAIKFDKWKFENKWEQLQEMYIKNPSSIDSSILTFDQLYDLYTQFKNEQ